MSLFRESLVRGSVPQQEVFAYTDTVNPSVHHEWATGALLYFATLGTGLGLTGLVILKFSLAAAVWLVLYRVARMRGCHPYLFALFSIACFPVFWVGFATIRAQLFTMLFLALQLWMQELDWRGRRAWVLGWLAMLVLWLNVHAGFVVGCGLIAFHSVERFASAWLPRRSIRDAAKATWHLMAIAPISCAALLINPYGWQYIPYLVRAIGMERPLIREWLPLWHTHDPVGTLTLFAACIGLMAFGFWSNRGRRRGFAFLALSAYMTLKHIRHGSIFAVVWIAYVPAWLSRTSFGKSIVAFLEGHRPATVRTCQGFACLFLAFACFQPFWRLTLPPQPRYSSASYPSEAIRYLKAHHFEGNLMTPFHVGAYVSWEMYPQVRVSFDGRYEVAYQEHMMGDHNRFYDADEDWWSIVGKYSTDAVLIHRDAKICSELETEKGIQELRYQTGSDWELIYQDDAFVLIGRPNLSLPAVDRRGIPIRDAAWEAFTPEHSHWNAGRFPRRRPGVLAMNPGAIEFSNRGMSTYSPDPSSARIPGRVGRQSWEGHSP